MRIKKEYANYQDGGINNLNSMSLEELQDLLRDLQSKQDSIQVESHMPSQRDLQKRAISEGHIPATTPSGTGVMEVSGQVIDTPIGRVHHGSTSSELHQQREEDESARALQQQIFDVRKAIKNYEPNKGTGENYQKGGRLPRFM